MIPVEITKRNSWALNLWFCCPCANVEACVRLYYMKAWKQSPIPWIDRYRLLMFAVSWCFSWHASYQPTSGQVRSVALMFVRQGLNRCPSIKKSSKMKPNSPTPSSFSAIKKINIHHPRIPFSSILQPQQIWGHWQKSNLLGRDMVELLGCYASLPSIFDRFCFMSIVESMSGAMSSGAGSFSNFQVQDGSAQ